MVGHHQPEAEQARHAEAEPLGLAQGRVEDEPQGQHQLDRQVGVSRLSARRGACQPASAASSSRNVRSPRRRSPAS